MASNTGDVTAISDDGMSRSLYESHTKQQNNWKLQSLPFDAGYLIESLIFKHPIMPTAQHFALKT